MRDRGIVLKNEGADRHCAISTPSNLMLMLDRRNIRQANSSTQTCLYNPVNTHQRCFNQFDRITQTRLDGFQNKNQPCSQSAIQDRFHCDCGKQWRTGQERFSSTEPVSEPVLNSILAEICTGPTAVCKCSPRIGTYVEWGPEYTLLVVTKRGKGWRYAQNKGNREMSDYEERQRETAELWAAAFVEQERLEDIAARAKSAHESQRSTTVGIEEELRQFVGGNIPKKLYRTDHGFVLVTYQSRRDMEPWVTVELMDVD